MCAPASREWQDECGFGVCAMAVLFLRVPGAIQSATPFLRPRSMRGASSPGSRQSCSACIGCSMPSQSVDALKSAWSPHEDSGEGRGDRETEIF
eukprot:6491603-Alexandrium_andersonii.AAC.1